MKKLFFSFLSVVLASATAAAANPSEEFMSLADQTKIINQNAQSIRESYYRGGYDDVESSIEFMDKAKFTAYTAERYESSLEDSEVKQIFQCINSKSCEVYLVVVSSSYHAGSGLEAHFVLLYTKSGKTYTFQHMIYAE